MRKSKIGRRPKKIEQNARFLIVSEGAVTEQQYIYAVKRSLKIRSADFRFVPPGPTTPEQIVRLAHQLDIDARKDDPFDEVWCIIDTEATIDQTCRPGFLEAISLAEQWKISLAISNPCIELWILLHKEDYQAWIDSHVCQRRCAALKLMNGKHIIFPDQLYAEYWRARGHAVKLDEKHQRDGKRNVADRNPSSSVYKLVDSICLAFKP